MYSHIFCDWEKFVSLAGLTSNTKTVKKLSKGFYDLLYLVSPNCTIATPSVLFRHNKNLIQYLKYSVYTVLTKIQTSFDNNPEIQWKILSNFYIPIRTLSEAENRLKRYFRPIITYSSNSKLLPSTS